MIGGLLLALSIILILWLLINKDERGFIAIIIFMMTSKFLMFKIGFSLAPTTFNFLFLALLIFAVVMLVSKRRFKIVDAYWITTLLGLSIYVITLDAFRGVEVWPHLLMLRHYYWGFLIYFVLNFTFRSVSVENFDRNLMFFVLFQLFLGIAQYSFSNIADYFRISEYNWRGQDLRVLDSENWLENNIVIGTLFNMANYGNLLAIIYSYLLFKFLRSELLIKKWLFLLFSILLILCVGLTGIRTSLATLILGISLNFLVYSRRQFMLVSLLMITLGFSFLGGLSQIGVAALENHVGAENPILRLAGVFAVFDADFNADISTLSRSYAMFEVVKENYIFGVGTFYDKSYTGISSVTDAFLLFHIAELGVIGLLLLLLPYYNVYIAIRRNSLETSKMYFILIFVMLVQTITDNGLWYLVANIVMFVIISVNIVHNRYVQNNNSF